MNEANGHSKNGSKNIWKTLKLKDICLDKEGLRRGPFGSAIKKEFFVPDGYKIYEQANAIYDDASRGRYFISESKYKELENFKVDEGDFIVSCSGTLGRISQIPKGFKPGVINQALLRIRLKNGIILNKYFLYYFRSSFFQKRIVEESQGTAMSNLIGIKDFKEIEIPIPSIEDQQNVISKIEELFSELDKSIEQLRTAQQQLKVYRQSVLKCAFQGKYSEKVNDWKVLKLKEASMKIVVGYVGPITEHLTESNGVSFLTTTHIGANELLTHDIRQVTKSFNEKNKKSQVVPGDIIIARHGDSGKACIIPESIKEAQVSNAVILRPNPNIVLSKFICLRLNYERQTMQKMKVGGVHQVVNTKSMEAFEVLLPPVEEQERILNEIESRLSVADKLEETITNSLQQAEALRQSILKKAFEGKLLQ